MYIISSFLSRPGGFARLRDYIFRVCVCMCMRMRVRVRVRVRVCV